MEKAPVIGRGEFVAIGNTLQERRPEKEAPTMREAGLEFRRLRATNELLVYCDRAIC
jgi:hypothetical protein